MVGNRDRVSNYYSVTAGKVVKSLGKVKPENMEGVTERTTDDGPRYEIQSDYIAAHITGARLKDPPEGKSDWGKQVELSLIAGGQKAILNIKFDSSYGRGFMFPLPNVDLSLPVEIEPYAYTSKDGKDKRGLSIIQDGQKIDWAYGTKDNPDGMPPLKQVKFKGETRWDNTDQMAYLEKRFNDWAAQFESEKPQEQTAGEQESPSFAEAKGEVDF